jgi:hypothetical protein
MRQLGCDRHGSGASFGWIWRAVSGRVLSLGEAKSASASRVSLIRSRFEGLKYSAGVWNGVDAQRNHFDHSVRPG